jgi:predicted homoserine dehydrogenase-like protein
VNLYTKLLAREAAGRPVTVGLIGAGKFGTMFLAQARTTRGIHVVAVADLDVGRACRQLRSAGWPDDAVAAQGVEQAAGMRRIHVTDDAQALIASPAIEVVVE